MLWRIKPLLGKDLQTNNETTAVVMQRRGITPSQQYGYCFKGVIQPVAKQLQQLDYNNGKRVFSTWSAPMSCL
jgi:hypothetical protein